MNGKKSLEFVDLPWAELGPTALEIVNVFELDAREHKLTSGHSRFGDEPVWGCEQHARRRRR